MPTCIKCKGVFDVTEGVFINTPELLKKLRKTGEVFMCRRCWEKLGLYEKKPVKEAVESRAYELSEAPPHEARVKELTERLTVFESEIASLRDENIRLRKIIEKGESK